ncbi:unnamed protein product [Nezara viridula]|uniref:Uncharacterized protein n=1 Tax=Nezara viridula TaxID=85310 RepID=A0A9P0HM78_NEZVI|nr:unnamed protein product [Nezara viridula]
MAFKKHINNSLTLAEYNIAWMIYHSATSLDRLHPRRLPKNLIPGPEKDKPERKQ